MDKSFAWSLGLLAFCFASTSQAVQVPTFDIPNISAAGQPGFDARGLTVSLSSAGNGYSLSATGTGTFTFYAPDTAHSYAGTSGTYTLNANFDAAGHYLGGGTLSIKGTLAGTPAAWGPTSANTTLWSANLSSFGYSQSKDALGFGTDTFGGWANTPEFTGGSLAESVYLFDFLGNTGGNGRLQPLVNAFAAGNLSVGVGTYQAVESVATVPVPAAGILFGSSLLGLLGIGRKRKISG